MENEDRTDGLTTYINIRTDYGFKRMFGSPKRKNLVIRFLNAILPENLTVTDVQFHDKEVLPADETGKRILYDIYCTSDIDAYTELFFKTESMIIEDLDENGKPRKYRTHHFILEMQNEYEPPFEDRVIYYGAKTIASQGSRGWDYILQPVVTITVTNFDFPHMSKKIHRRIGFADLDSGELFSDKMQVISLSLAQIRKKKWRDCKTELERILYLISNMDKLNKNSEAYKSSDYNEFFDAAESSSMCAEEAVAYSQSLQRLRSAEEGVRYAQRQYYAIGMTEGREAGIIEGRQIGLIEGIKEGRQEGIKEGRQEGIKEGRQEGIKEGMALGVEKEKIKAIQIMYSLGIDQKTIADKYQLPVSDVDKIINFTS